MILAFIAEKNLPWSMAPALIELAQQMAIDVKVLQLLQMGRTWAYIQSVHGLSSCFRDSTFQHLKNTIFSLNLDEATNKGRKRVLSVLVSYFSREKKKVVLEHLTAFELIVVNTESIYRGLCELMTTGEIPWQHCLSLLMDSCKVMRGCKNGLEVRIRTEKNQHLQDIDGDICHHIHNAAKKFSKPFLNHVECLFWDVASDFKWSADMLDYLREICSFLNIAFTKPEKFTKHRWLSAFDVAASTIRLYDAYQLLYFGFLSQEDKHSYKPVILAILRRQSVSKESHRELAAIWSKLKLKKMTKEGKARKERLVDKLFYKSEKTRLILHIYVNVLPILKSYVMLFQTKVPLVHKLYDRLIILFRDFLACFIKPQYLVDKSVNQLLTQDLSANVLPHKQMFLGEVVRDILRNYKQNDPRLINFLNKAREAYIACASYLQQKLPLQNRLLKFASAIDPMARGHSLAASYLKKLCELLSSYLTLEDKLGLEGSIHRYMVDSSLPPYDEDEERCDEWWGVVLESGKYPGLSKVALAVLTIFHGPQIESSFSVMTNIIDDKSTTMSIETYSATQTTKYRLMAEGKTAVQYFSRAEPTKAPVDRSLIAHMKGARKKYIQQHQRRREQKEIRCRRLKLKTKVLSKLKYKKALDELCKKNRQKHKGKTY